MNNKKAIVTGGAGFIGSHLVLHLVNLGWKVLNIDKLTYSSNIEYLSSLSGNSNYSFLQADIGHRELIPRAFSDFQPDVVFHLAAESHVDRSIENSVPFIETNILGTHHLLEVSREYCATRKKSFKFIHVSTDEVYGSLDSQGSAFIESSPYLPNSPYAASKAASDHLVRAWLKTYNLPAIVTHSSNNYGPHQHAEKLIPKVITHALKGLEIPVYGDGAQVRDWIHVSDHVRGLVAVAESGQIGETYNFGGECEKTNLDVVNLVCAHLGGRSHIKHVQDRKGHDFRYALNIAHASSQLKWRPEVNFESGLIETIKWYVEVDAT